MFINDIENILDVEFENNESSLLKRIFYDTTTGNLRVVFNDNLDIRYFPDSYHYNVPKQLIANWIESKSLGKFYNTNIKNKFMAKSDKIIYGKIDLKKVNKEWLFKSEGTGAIYLDVVIFYNEKEDKYKQNGMIVQSVPKDVREEDKDAKGEILGNIREFKRTVAMPGTETGVRNNGAASGTGLPDDDDNDVPF